jgi:hypothetical protein
MSKLLLAQSFLLVMKRFLKSPIAPAQPLVGVDHSKALATLTPPNTAPKKQRQVKMAPHFKFGSLTLTHRHLALALHVITDWG